MLWQASTGKVANSGRNGAVFRATETLDLRGNLERRVLCGNFRDRIFRGARRHSFHLGAKYLEVLDSKDLLAKDLAKLASCFVGNGFEVGYGFRVQASPGDFPFEACHGPISNATGIDERELIEVCCDVEREAVRGDSTRNVDADSGDLALPLGLVLGDSCTTLFQRAAPLQVAPDARQSANATGLNTEFGAKADESFFQKADEVHGADAATTLITQAAQIEDGVANELARAVIGDVTATVDVVECDTAAGKKFTGGKDVGAVRITAQGKDRRMFEEQKNITDAVLLAHFNQLRLKTQRFAVVDAAEIEVLDHWLL